jgi:predicted secreted protein
MYLVDNQAIQFILWVICLCVLLLPLHIGIRAQDWAHSLTGGPRILRGVAQQ